MAFPTSLYDIFPDDFLHLSGGYEPAFLTRDEVSRSQVSIPITRTLSIASTSSSTSTLDSALTDLSDPTPDDLEESLPLQRDEHLTPAAMRAAQRRARRPGPLRRRGPNKRCPGTGYSDMMVRSLRLILNL